MRRVQRYQGSCEWTSSVARVTKYPAARKVNPMARIESPNQASNAILAPVPTATEGLPLQKVAVLTANTSSETKKLFAIRIQVR